MGATQHNIPVRPADAATANAQRQIFGVVAVSAGVHVGVVFTVEISLWAESI